MNSIRNIGKTVTGLRNMSSAFYAVANGRQTGIFNSWSECEKQVKGYSKPIYKKFKIRSDAEDFLKQNSSSTSANSKVASRYEAANTSELYKLGTKDKILAKPDPPKQEKYVDYWPEDDDLGSDDEEYLLAAMDEAEGVPAKKMKRNFSFTDQYPDLEIIGSRKLKNIEFSINKDGYILVYTDGSCRGNGKASAVAGYGVYFDDNHPLNAAEPVKGRATNNVGEILASVYAIRKAKELGIDKLCIATDSQFLIHSIERWIKGWKRNGWKTSSGQPVKNFDEFVELDQLLEDKSVKIKWVHVRGHKGIHGNEMADKLAREGAEKYRWIKRNQ
ncbi:RNASEH1.2 family protein [Megaselia abdita]